MADKFLTPPPQTQLRAPRLDEGADVIGNVAGNDPYLLGKLAQLLVKVREPLAQASLAMPAGGQPSMSIAPFIRGAGGAGRNATIPLMQTRFKPHQVEGMLGDITKGRQDMIVGKRIASEDPIANVGDFGMNPNDANSFASAATQEWNRFAQSTPEILQPGTGRITPEWEYRKRAMDSLNSVINDLLRQGNVRNRAERLVPQETPLVPAITERSFTDALMYDAMRLFLGGKAPHQKFSYEGRDLSGAQQAQIRPRNSQ